MDTTSRSAPPQPTEARSGLSIRDLVVTASQAVVITVIGAGMAFAFAEPGPHGYAILVIGLPAFLIGPAVLVGYFLWVLGRTGRVMLLANAPVALLSGWMTGMMLTEGVGAAARGEVIGAVPVALVASLIGVVAGLRWPGPGRRRAA